MALRAFVERAGFRSFGFAKDEMNIVYVHCHDAGRFLAPYGHPVPTPHLLNLARESVVFRKAFACAPTCSPSRAGLLTGRFAHECGMLGLVHRGFRLSDPRQHLGAFLRTAGYETVLAGVQHELAPNQLTTVYEQVLSAEPDRCSDGGRAGPSARLDGHRDVPAHPAMSAARSGMTCNYMDTPASEHPGFVPDDMVTAASAVAFLRRPHTRPFFLSCGFFLPHREFPGIGSDARPDELAVPPGLPDHPAIRRDVAAYHAAVAVMDRSAGVVLDALRTTESAHDTLVVFTTDHGMAFPGMKCHLTDGGTGVALIVRPPEGQAGASDALVSHLDVFPTICDYLDLSPPPGLRGRSLRPLIERRTTRAHEAVFAEINYHTGYEPARSIRTSRFKLIRHFEEERQPLAANTDESPSKDVWVEAGWRERPRDPVQLYDLVLDPLEHANLAADPAFAAVRQDLAQRLDAWMHDTADPLLHGRVPRPPGALVNVRHSLHPEAGPFEPPVAGGINAKEDHG